MHNCRTWFYMPPLAKISGGMRVISDLCALLRDNGHDAVLVSSAPVPETLLPPGQNACIMLADASPAPNDRWVIPEGWPAALGKGLAAHAACAVYVQNWAFLHGNLPQGVHWQNLNAAMLAVSDPVARFIQDTTGKIAPIIRPAIKTDIFFAGGPKPVRPMRIAWMPRKNRGMARQIREIFEAVKAREGLPPVEWLEIESKTQTQVAEILRSAHIFLAAGFPEGLGLPPLEAMACGCLPVGFTGIGGWDYMRQALPGWYEPAFPLRKVPFGGNGLYVEDANSMGAARALAEAIKIILENSQTYGEILANGQKTAACYCQKAQKDELLRAWQDDDLWRN